MSREADLWGPGGQPWLEEHIDQNWRPYVEEQVRQAWERPRGWLLECHPEKALLFLLRQFLVDPSPFTEDQLRSLLPLLAARGHPSRFVLAMALLGLTIRSLRGVDDEVRTLSLQISREALTEGSPAWIARRWLQGECLIASGQFEDVDRTYQELLHTRIDGSGLAFALLGRLLERMAFYVLREPPTSLATLWLASQQAWRGRSLTGFLSQRLGRLEGLHEVAARQAVEHDPVGNGLRMLVEIFGSESMESTEIHLARDQEQMVIKAVLDAMGSSSSSHAVHRAGLMASAYGDAFWIAKAGSLNLARESAAHGSPAYDSQSSDAVQQRLERSAPAEYRFTFFDAFGGLDSEGLPLFPRGYGRKKVKQLLALLLLQPRHQLVKDVLVSEMFGDSPGSEAYLHVTLFRLRALFRRSTSGNRDFVYAKDGLIILEEEIVGSVDVQEYRKLASVGHQLWMDDRPAASALYERAVNLYSPVIAPEFEYEDWLIRLKAELESTQFRMLDRLRDEASTAGHLYQAVQYGERILVLDDADGTNLEKLCRDLCLVGDERRARKLCADWVRQLQQDGESIPKWVSAYAASGHL